MTKSILQVVNSDNIDKIIDYVGIENIPQSLGGDLIIDSSVTWPLWSLFKSRESSVKVTLQILKQKGIMPFFFSNEKYFRDWKNELKEEIMSVFSEHIVARSRFMNAGEKSPVQREDRGFVVQLLEKILGKNCCTKRTGK